MSCLSTSCPVQLVRELGVPPGWEKEHDDEDHVAWLTHETVQVGHTPQPHVHPSTCSR